MEAHTLWRCPWEQKLPVEDFWKGHEPGCAVPSIKAVPERLLDLRTKEKLYEQRSKLTLRGNSTQSRATPRSASGTSLYNHFCGRLCCHCRQLRRPAFSIESP